MTARGEEATTPSDVYLSGDRLYGDDFTQEQIERWFAREADAYFAISGSKRQEWSYFEWAKRHGYDHLPQTRFDHVLGFGSAEGAEIIPIKDRVERLTLVDSSSAWNTDPQLEMPIDLKPADPTGDIDLPDASVDLVVCFGVLHHIPNVSHVLGEFSRVLCPGGWAVVREPIVSMGDWSQPRQGLTAQERGLPLEWVRRQLGDLGLTICRETLIGFPPVARLTPLIGGSPYNSPFWTKIDQWICGLFRRQVRYHARSGWQRLRPTSVFLVLRR